ncbi:MAG TPA: CBASS cGAMP-activated phospholipase [Longimicrobiales bacterium]
MPGRTRIRVLSIDGGGIRGIIPAMVLAEIERRLDRPISEIFHLIAGTSTGGILALGLTVPGPDGKPRYSAQDLVELYEREGGQIFSRSTWHRIRAFGNAADEKYSADGIEGVLKRKFGDARLKDALTEVLVTSYEIERRTPFFFRSRRAREQAEYDYLMRDVARATSAAPTYFEPHRIVINNDPLDYFALIDGGVFANNPAMCAYAEAKADDPRADVMLVSLGTGELVRPIAYDDAKGWGLLQWAQPILGTVFDGVSDTVDYQLARLLTDGGRRGQRYFRFQTRLDDGNDDMDDASRTNIRVLKLVAEEMMHRQRQQLNTLCRQLRRELQPAG